MAQLKDEGEEGLARARRVLRQRPGLAIACALAAALALGACGLGVFQAWSDDGVVIARAEDGEEETGDAGEGAETDGDEGDAAEEAGSDDGSEEDTVVVDVSGAVANPCVVELPAGSRVQDAIEAAGGLTEDADISSLNRATVLTDGQKVHVPAVGEEVDDASSASTTDSSSSSSALVNINTADADELDTLPGIGPVLAQAIIDDREANGSFTSIEDIMRVSGIGEAKYANIKDLICV